MRINKNQYNCCGCTACENICPKQAITMQPDNLGFLYPQIDDSKCIDCGLCVKTCNFSDNYKTIQSNNYPLIFAVRSNKIEELQKSQSGAAFFELAKNQIPEYMLINYQECLMCNYIGRQETLPKNREIIKELGLSFRGTWISFESFEKGYEPSPINIKQVKIMIEALKNFYMMFRAIIEQGIKVDFENGEILARHYDKEKKLFLNYPAPLMLPEKHYDTIKADDKFEKDIMKLPQTEMEIEYEFLNYVPIRIRDNKEQDGRYYYPRARFIAERKSGFVISHDLINKNDYENERDYIIESVELLINNFYKMGRPKSIYVRDEETKMYLKDIADKAKIKLIVKPKLKAIDEFYRSLSRMGM